MHTERMCIPDCEVSTQASFLVLPQLLSSPLAELLSLLVLLPLTILTPLWGILQFRSDTFFVKNKNHQSDITAPPHTLKSDLLNLKKIQKNKWETGVFWTPICKTLFISAPCSFLLKPESSKTRFSNSTCRFLFVSGIQKRWVPFLIQGWLPVK